MALITCPECSKQISEFAACCPNCGFQLTPENISEIKEKYEREFYDFLNDTKQIKKETIPQESKPKFALRPILLTLLFSLILLLSIYLINFIGTYKTSDVRRYENGSNDLGNFKSSTNGNISAIQDRFSKSKLDSINAYKAKKNKEYQAKLDSIDKKWEYSKAGKIQKNHPEWSKEDCIMVAANVIWIGMTIDMLKTERGMPDSTNPSNYGNGVRWQWCWFNHHPSCFYGGDNGIITAYN